MVIYHLDLPTEPCLQGLRSSLVWNKCGPRVRIFRLKFSFGWYCITTTRLQIGQPEGLPHQPLCPLCCQEPESIHHLLVQCPFSQPVWYDVLRNFNLQSLTPSGDSAICEWLFHMGMVTLAKRSAMVFSKDILGMYNLWLERNARTFDRIASSQQVMVDKILQEINLVEFTQSASRCLRYLAGPFSHVISSCKCKNRLQS